MSSMLRITPKLYMTYVATFECVLLLFCGLSNDEYFEEVLFLLLLIYESTFQDFDHFGMRWKSALYSTFERPLRPVRTKI